MALAVALRGTFAPRAIWGSVFIGIFAVGIIVAGLFTTDPENGYPPGSPVPFRTSPPTA